MSSLVYLNPNLTLEEASELDAQSKRDYCEIYDKYKAELDAIADHREKEMYRQVMAPVLQMALRMAL